MDLKGKAAVVTGSSSDGGVGAECAKILASRGCNVVVNYATNADGGDAIAAECAAAGVESIAVQGDVAKDGDCRRLVRGGGRPVGTARRAGQQRRRHQDHPAPALRPARRRRIPAHLRGQPDRELSDVPGGRAASQGHRRRGDREHFLDRRHARRRQLDRLCRLQGRAQHAHDQHGARAGAGGARQCAVPGRPARAAGRARS